MSEIYNASITELVVGQNYLINFSCWKPVMEVVIYFTAKLIYIIARYNSIHNFDFIR